MAGTRGGVGRIVAMVIALAVVLVLVLADVARAGTYNVAQCGWGVGVELDPSLPRTEGVAAYLHPGYCTAPARGTAAAMEFDMGMANTGEQGLARARWAAPLGTNFAGVRFTWSGEMAPGVWQVGGIDDGTEFRGVAMELGTGAPQPVAVALSGPARAFEVRLECLLLGTYWGCTRSKRSTMWLSGLTLTVDDPAPPQARLGGTLAATGWHRGRVSLEVGGEDPVGAGVYGTAATVDETTVFTAPVACAVATIEGEVRATRLQPCPATAMQASEVDTAALADGVHTLRGCAVDFGGGWGCAPEVQIQVDNSPPAVEFAAAPEGQVAATVSDPFSGPAAGTIAVRRADSETWTDLPTTLEHGGATTATLRAQLPDLSAGAYFFRATATDGAGNSGSAQFRAAGSAAAVRRQLAGVGSGRAPRGARGRVVHLAASLVVTVDGRGRASRGGSPLTVDFGTAVVLRGRLADAHGDGVPKRPVAVVTRPAGAGGGGPERQRV
ncbi:MAG TPA: hypothetical protein VGI17_02990, partial [Solirubrobacterales bacterium]